MTAAAHGPKSFKSCPRADGPPEAELSAVTPQKPLFSMCGPVGLVDKLPILMYPTCDGVKGMG